MRPCFPTFLVLADRRLGGRVLSRPLGFWLIDRIETSTPGQALWVSHVRSVAVRIGVNMDVGN